MRCSKDSKNDKVVCRREEHEAHTAGTERQDRSPTGRAGKLEVLKHTDSQRRHYSCVADKDSHGSRIRSSL